MFAAESACLPVLPFRGTFPSRTSDGASRGRRWCRGFRHPASSSSRTSSWRDRCLSQQCSWRFTYLGVSTSPPEGGGFRSWCLRFLQWGPRSKIFHTAKFYGNICRSLNFQLPFPDTGGRNKLNCKLPGFPDGEWYNYKWSLSVKTFPLPGSLLSKTMSHLRLQLVNKWHRIIFARLK